MATDEAGPVTLPDPDPEAPVSPRGIVRFKIWLGGEPEIVAAALEPAAPVVTVPIVRSFAAPGIPVAPIEPVSPLGIVRLMT